jgi:hypothetical protein
MSFLSKYFMQTTNVNSRSADFLKISSKLIIIVVVVGIFISVGNVISQTIAIKDIHKNTNNLPFIDIELLCSSNNTALITEGSEIECSIATKSDSLNFSVVDITLQVYNSRNLSVGGCVVKLNNVSSDKFTMFSKCISAPQNYVFIPNGLETYSFNAIVNAVSISGENRIDTKFFDSNLIVPSKSQEIALGVSKTILLGSIASLGVAVIAILLSIFNSVDQIENSKKLQERQFQFQKDLHHEEQQNLLKSLLVEIRTIKENCIGWKTTLQKPPQIPLYLIKELDAGFYSKNLDSFINDKETEMLKKKIFSISDKIKLLNDYMRWLHKSQFDPIYFSTANPTDGMVFRDLIFNNFYPRLTEKDGGINNLIELLEDMLETLRKNFEIR